MTYSECFSLYSVVRFGIIYIKIGAKHLSIYYYYFYGGSVMSLRVKPKGWGGQSWVDYTKNWQPPPTNLTHFLDGKWEEGRWESDVLKQEELFYLREQKLAWEGWIESQEEELFALLDNKKKIQYYEKLFRDTNKKEEK
jgi:hypothetical protein